MNFLNLQRLLDANVEPISLTEAKAQLRIDFPDDDNYLTGLIGVARQWAEEYTKRSFLSQTWLAQFPHWPDRILFLDSAIELEGLYWYNPDMRNLSRDEKVFLLPRPNLLSVDSIIYYDGTGEEQTVDPSQYVVEQYSFPGLIKMRRCFTNPSLDCDRLAPISICYKAGFGTRPESVPLTIKQALLLLVTHFYESRTPVEVGSGVVAIQVPMSVQSLLDSSKRKNI